LDPCIGCSVNGRHKDRTIRGTEASPILQVKPNHPPTHVPCHGSLLTIGSSILYQYFFTREDFACGSNIHVPEIRNKAGIIPIHWFGMIDKRPTPKTIPGYANTIDRLIRTKETAQVRTIAHGKEVHRRRYRDDRTRIRCNQLTITETGSNKETQSCPGNG
jgi:hypothetical protein